MLLLSVHQSESENLLFVSHRDIPEVFLYQFVTVVINSLYIRQSCESLNVNKLMHCIMQFPCVNYAGILPYITYCFCLYSNYRHVQGGPKKVSQIIFAITLSTASQFP